MKKWAPPVLLRHRQVLLLAFVGKALPLQYVVDNGSRRERHRGCPNQPILIQLEAVLLRQAVGKQRGEVRNADIFDEDFGKMKMEIFKSKCRGILGLDQQKPQRR